MNLYLVDTPVWIDYLGGRETEVTGRFAEVLERGYPVGLTGVSTRRFFRALPR